MVQQVVMKVLLLLNGETVVCAMCGLTVMMVPDVPVRQRLHSA